jgi:rhodanese-related sulfurtransferase
MDVQQFVQNNIWLVLAAVVSGLMFLWPSVAKRLSRTREVGPVEAVQLINRQDAAIVDVREPGEFKGGHIPNARNIPLGQIAERMKDLEKLKGKPVLVICASGNRSASACATLHQVGFEQVYSLAGGMGAWQQAGMPSEKG